MTLRAVFLVSLLATSFNAVGQQQPVVPPISERVNVSIVNVDVTVVDRTGKPTADLKAEDFVIFEDGKLQKVTNFYVVDRNVVKQVVGASLVPAPEIAADAGRFRRKALLLIDNHFLDKRRRNAALAEVRKFINSDFAGNYDWGVASLTASVVMVQPFTSDRKTIDTAIDKVLGGAVIPRAVMDDRGALGVNATNTLGVTGAMAVSAKNSAEALDTVDENLRQKGTVAALRETARAMIEACRAYSDIEGKKLIVLVTGGIEVDERQPEPTDFHKARDDFDKQSGQILETMVQEANAANFNVHVLNAAGMVSPSDNFDVANSGPQSRFSGSSETRNSDTLPNSLAAQTGGMYLTSNAVGDSIRKIDSVTSTFYSLGYSPKHFEDGEYHRIVVKLKNNRNGYRIFNRAGYVDASENQRTETSMKVALSATIPEGNLPLEVKGGTPVKKGDGRHFSVPVTASFPMNRLTFIPNGDVSTGRVHVYLSVFDTTDANIGYHHAIKDVELTAQQLHQLQASPVPFRYTMNVDLAAGGVYRVIMFVRDDVTDESGKASTIVDTRG